MPEDRRVRAAFTALAVGDAVGMPTEFMTRQAIKARFSAVDTLLRPDQGEKHANLPYASVTDDTEQNLYLLRAYRAAGRVDAHETAERLLCWAEETHAAEKRYIGPSSLAALGAIRGGAPIETSGLCGTTCGGVMRAPAAALYAPHDSSAALENDLYACLLPTHNTSEALEAAGALGFALDAAVRGAGMDEILIAALSGAERLMRFAPEAHCAPSTAARIRVFSERAKTLEPGALLDELYAVYGTGLPSADVAGAAFAIFFTAGADVWKAICLGASVGGDTDTIAALAGALSAAYAGETNIPEAVLQAVFSHNPILHGAPWEEQL